MIEKDLIVHRKNTKKIKFILRSSTISLEGFNAYFTVKRNYATTDTLINIGGIIEENEIYFEITSDNNNIKEGRYVYDITITSPSERYTLTKGVYEIKPVVKD